MRRTPSHHHSPLPAVRGILSLRACQSGRVPRIGRTRGPDLLQSGRMPRIARTRGPDLLQSGRMPRIGRTKWPEQLQSDTFAANRPSGRTARATTPAGSGQRRDPRGSRRRPRSAAECPLPGSARGLSPKGRQRDARSPARRATTVRRALRVPSLGRHRAQSGNRLPRQPPRTASRSPQGSRRQPPVPRRRNRQMARVPMFSP
jgi:hypothetical protein